MISTYTFWTIWLFVHLILALGLLGALTHQAMAVAFPERDFPTLKASNAPGHTFVVLEVEPFSDQEQQELEQPPFDGPELKFRFGRHLESVTGADIFGYRI